MWFSSWLRNLSALLCACVASVPAAARAAEPTIYNLGTLGGTGSESFAVNGSGQVTGFSNSAGNGATHAFLYSGTPGSGGAMADLGTLGGTDSWGNAINASGQVAGWADLTGESVSHAFRYAGTPGSGGAMADLGTLGGQDSLGLAINTAGQVAGYSMMPDGSKHAFLNTGTPGSSGAMADLGSLGTDSYGAAINAAGQVGGLFFTAGGAQHAFLYTGTPGVNGHMIDLDAWLDANNPVEGAKWELTAVTGLTDTGLVTGVGVYNDGITSDTRAFLLDASALAVPEPGSIVLATLGALAVLGHYWRALSLNHPGFRPTPPHASSCVSMSKRFSTSWSRLTIW